MLFTGSFGGVKSNTSFAAGALEASLHVAWAGEKLVSGIKPDVACGDDLISSGPQAGDDRRDALEGNIQPKREGLRTGGTVLEFAKNFQVLGKLAHLLRVQK